MNTLASSTPKVCIVQEPLHLLRGSSAPLVNSPRPRGHSQGCAELPQMLADKPLKSTNGGLYSAKQLQKFFSPRKRIEQTVQGVSQRTTFLDYESSENLRLFITGRFIQSLLNNCSGLEQHEEFIFQPLITWGHMRHPSTFWSFTSCRNSVALEAFAPQIDWWAPTSWAKRGDRLRRGCQARAPFCGSFLPCTSSHKPAHPCAQLTFPQGESASWSNKAVFCLFCQATFFQV